MSYTKMTLRQELFNELVQLEKDIKKKQDRKQEIVMLLGLRKDKHLNKRKFKK